MTSSACCSSCRSGCCSIPPSSGATSARLRVVIAAVIVGKAAIFAVIVRAFGYRRVVPLAVGLTLFQVGEFAFVLARVGLASGAITDDLYALVLNTAVATMALTPVVSSATPRIYRRVRGPQTREPLQAMNIPDAGLTDHVVIAGAGRVGRTIAEALSSQKLPSVLIELDDRRFQQARPAGLAVIYGDASQAVVLEAAHLSRASALLVTVPDLHRCPRHRSHGAAHPPCADDRRQSGRPRRGARAVRVGDRRRHVAGSRGGDRDDAGGAHPIRNARRRNPARDDPNAQGPLRHLTFAPASTFSRLWRARLLHEWCIDSCRCVSEPLPLRLLAV